MLMPPHMSVIPRVQSIPHDWGPPTQTYERYLNCRTCGSRTMHEIMAWIAWDSPWPLHRIVAICRDEQHGKDR